MSNEYRKFSGNGNPFEQFSQFMQPSPEMFTRMMQPILSVNASLMEMQSKAWHTAAEASREWFEFVSKRLEQDARFMEQLKDTENPQTFMDTCTQFSRRMAKDYQEEFSELSKLSGKVAGGTSEVMREASETTSSLSREAAHT